MMWIGVAIVVLTFVLITKRFDSRMCLFIAGLIMCFLSGTFMPAFDRFFTGLFIGNLPQIIGAAMGYAYLMSYIKADRHLASWLVKGLMKVRWLIIPGVIVAAGAVVMAIASNAGTAAALGPIVIPVMIKAGIHPLTAATVLTLGGQGNYFGFGTHAAMIAQIANVEMSEVVFKHTWPVGAVVYVIVIVCAVLIAKMKKEDKGYVDSEDQFSVSGSMDKINYYFAILPFLPIVIVLLSTYKVLPKLNVQQAMLICAVWTMLTSRANVGNAVQQFTYGVGRAIADIVSIIACAGVFTYGMEVIGLTPALIAAMKSNPNIAIVGAAVGPALIAFLCGSGDAATLAFNGSITPQVAALGLDPVNIGTIAYMCGCFGRTMSPVAGITIICAGYAKVNPIDIAKRCMPSSIISVIVAMILLGYVM